jgi:cAMP-binding proteins - catabolite gene activator and regulatory subunit of cAMP-dependent protein kinases
MKLNKTHCDLNSCFLCRQCSKEWLPALNAHRKTFHVSKGEMLFKEGDNMTGIWFINRGKFKVHKQWGEDKELIVRLARDGDIVGHRGMGSDNVYPVSATALEASDVCFVDIEFFMATLKVNQQFLFELTMFFASELKESEKRMRNLAHMPVIGRVANSLLTLQDKFGTDASGNINMTLSRQDLASYAGTTYETVFRILNELVDANVVKLSGKCIAITDAAGLAAFMKEG